ncbi:unnamed protein product [Phytophthora fragariaefolia]|uniref:Unnamed protein product n=1 Tax=Phytophthora fragariaefolia TaxID=1490495 RepID=A0A9W6XCL4_9STRA|nr:unnamed protein product [Phytophthora fragariaefolia]
MASFIHRSISLLIILVVTLLGCLVSAGAYRKPTIGSAVPDDASNDFPASQKSTIGSAVAEELANTTAARHLQTYSSTGFQTLMLNAVNKQRTDNGLSKLCTNKKLQAAAQNHSNDMASKNFMSHAGSDGSTMSQRITAAGYKWSACAENVAAGQTTVDEVMTAWMASSGHRANILSTKYTMFGCGYAYKVTTTYLHYWTQDFAYASTESC